MDILRVAVIGHYAATQQKARMIVKVFQNFNRPSPDRRPGPRLTSSASTFARTGTRAASAFSHHLAKFAGLSDRNCVTPVAIRSLQLRWEVFNIVNHPNLGLPIKDVSAANAGTITSSGTGRLMQIALRYSF